MAAPRKKKKTPPFDVTGIDFSVITTALETNGKMIEQIMNGIQYGSPEVRLLMLEECDFILECRVCRGLFRALPNFIAHKRVYCCRAYSDFIHDTHFQSATAVVPPPEHTVVVEPEAPEEAPSKSLRPPRQAKDKGKEQQKDRVGADTSAATAAAAATGSKKTGKTPGDSSNSNGKQQVASQVPDASNDGKPNGKTRSQQSEKPTAVVVEESLQKTVAQIESGQLGKSPEYVFYTAAADKAEREKKNMAKGSEAFHLTPIPATPCAVFVSKGSLPHDHTVLPSASSSSSSSSSSPLPPMVDGAAEIRERQPPVKNSPKEGSTAVVGQEEAVKKSAQGTAAMSGDRAEHAKKPAVSKATLRSVTKVVKELRQKKEERTTKEELASQKNKAPKMAQKNRKPILMSILSESKIAGSLPPSAQRTDPLTVAADVKSSKEMLPHLTSPSPTPSCRSVDQMSDVEQGKEGSLRAVVKRCLTGRPGSVRVSPFKVGDWNVDGDSVSEAGSYSDKGEGVGVAALAPAPLLRQDSNEDQGAMDVENLRCTICNKKFSAKKSLLYHCQTRHSGQRTIFPCPYCTGVFYYFWGLTRHLNTNHKKTRSAIDRMRKGLHSKAYKQAITEEEMTGVADSPARTGAKGKKDTPPKCRPSVHAKKIVAASKSAPSSTSGEAKKSPPNALFMPSRRRRVEVINSVKSKCRQSADLYKKVYANKRTESSVLSSSPVTGGSFSSPFRTRKLVAKALRTTRSKCVYNRSDIDSPPRSPKKVTPKTVMTKPGASSSSIKSEPSPDISSTRSSTRESVTGKDGPKESKAATPAAAVQRNSSKPQMPDAKDGKMGDAPSSDRCKPAAGTESSKEKPQPQGVAIKKNEASSQPQTRTRASSGAPPDVVVVPTTAVSSRLASSSSAPKTSAAATLPRVASPSQGRRVNKESSGFLHICPHCHRAFGRKISLESHINVCSRAKGPDAKSEAPNKDPSLQTSPLTQKSTGKKGEDVTSGGDLKSQDPQARTVRSSSRTLRESSVEKSELKSKPQANASAHPQDLRSNSKSSSSRGSSVDRQVTGNKTRERESRSRKRTDSKASSSRESSVDSVRTRRSESRPPQLSVERLSSHTTRESESSQDSWVDSRNQSSSRSKMSLEENNLLTISRQRLSEQLLAASTSSSSSRDKDPAVTKPKSESRRSSVSGDSLLDSKKSDLAHGSRSSPEKPASPRTVTTSVLRKGLKGKLPDSPRKLAPELQPASSSNAVSSSSSVKHSAGNPIPTLEQKVSVTKSVVQSKQSTGNPKPTLEQKVAITKSVVQSKQSTGNPKPTLEQKVAVTKSVEQSKHNTGNPKPTLEQKVAVTKSVVQSKHNTGNPKPTLEQKVTVTKSEVQSKQSTGNPKPTLEQKVTVAKSVVQSKQSTGNPKPTLEQKVTVTKSVVQSKQSTGNPKPMLEQQVTVTKSVTKEKPSIKPALHDMSPTHSGLQEKMATKPPTPDKPTTQLEKSQPKLLLASSSLATKPLLREKPVAKLATEEPSKTTPFLREKSAHEKSASALPEKSTPKSVPQVQDSKVLKGETKQAADCLPNHPQKQAPISMETVDKEVPSPQPATPTAAEKVTTSEQPSRETSSELNQRPRRKRRAPARVMDSEITLPNYITPKKKPCLHPPATQCNEEEEGSTLCSKRASQREQTSSEPPAPAAMMTRTRKDNGGEDRDADALMAEEDVRAERKTGRPSDRTRSRTYVVEPSHAGRLTCQDIRKVEEIVDETGLTCRHCEQHFTSVSNLRRHAIRHLGWKRFKCRLCFFCSYNRSECNTHIARTHTDRIWQAGINTRIESFVLDLSRQAGTVRSLKKRQTLDRQRRGETAGEGEKEAATYTHLRGSRSRKNAQAPPVSPQDEAMMMTVDQVEDNSVDANPTSSSAPLSRRAAANHGKPPAVAAGVVAVAVVAPATTEASKTKPTNHPTSFNISTRNSPRKFDTRPYTRDDNPSTLNTRKGAYVKRNISFLSLSLAEAGVVGEENEKVDSCGKQSQRGAVDENKKVDSGSKDKRGVVEEKKKVDSGSKDSQRGVGEENKKVDSSGKQSQRGEGEENKKVDSGSKDSQLSSVVGPIAVNTDAGSSSSSSLLLLDSQPHPGQKKMTAENVSNSAVVKDEAGVVDKKLDSAEQAMGDQGTGPATTATVAVVVGEEKNSTTAGTTTTTTVGEKTAESEGNADGQGEEKSQFVKRRRDDGDLMDVEELKTLPEHFMSDDDDD